MKIFECFVRTQGDKWLRLPKLETKTKVQNELATIICTGCTSQGNLKAIASGQSLMKSTEKTNMDNEVVL